MFLSANQMEAITIHSAKVAGRSVGVLMQMEMNCPTLDSLEIQFVTSQVYLTPVNDIHTVIIFSIEFARSYFCNSQ